MDFERFTDDIARNNWNVHGVTVHVQGKLAHSYKDTKSKYPIYSATKSILSLAVGIASDEGQIDTDRCILDYLPADYTSAMTPENRTVYEMLPLHRFLTMSLQGLPFRPEGESYLRYALNCKIDHPEERCFHYSNIPAYLVGVALAEALRGDVWAFIGERILKPLHITGARALRCPDGYFYGASGMEMSVEDLSRIGQLIGQEGAYEGKQIISRTYIRRACQPLQPNSGDGYGYLIWKYQSGVSINGKWKQRCFILPDRSLVVTYLSDIRDDTHDLQESMERNLL